MYIAKIFLETNRFLKNKIKTKRTKKTKKKERGKKED